MIGPGCGIWAGMMQGGPAAPSYSISISGITTNPTYGATAQIGAAITASASGWSDGPPTSVAWQWYDGAGAISGATSAAYTPVPGDDLEVIYPRATPSDTYSPKSGPSNTVRYAPPTSGGALADQNYNLSTGVQTYDTSGDFTGSALVYTVSTFDGVTINSSTGVVSTDTDTGVARSGTITVTATNSGGAVSSAYSLDIAAAASAPTISNFSTSGAPTSMSFDIDKNSTCYWLLDTNATRTAAQIITGGGASDGNQAVTLPSETISIDFSAVAYGNYFLHIVCDNGASSNVIDQAVELSAAPSAFVIGDWTSAQGSAASEIDLNIITLPASNNSAITSLEYSVDGGAAWLALTGTGTGARAIDQHSDGTTGTLTAGTSYDMMVRAVNAIGNGANSDTKATTSGAVASSDFVLNGAWFRDTATLAASTSVLEWEAYIKYPTATTSDSYLFAQVSGSALYTDGLNAWRTKVEDSTNALLYAGNHGSAGGVGTKRVVNYKVDLTTDEITIKVDGVVVANEPFTTASSGEFASNRQLGFASNGAGGALLPTDVEVEYFKVWRTTGGTRTLHKEISVAAQGSIAGINADPWITGTVTAA